MSWQAPISAAVDDMLCQVRIHDRAQQQYYIISGFHLLGDSAFMYPPSHSDPVHCMKCTATRLGPGALHLKTM